MNGYTVHVRFYSKITRLNKSIVLLDRAVHIGILRCSIICMVLVYLSDETESPFRRRKKKKQRNEKWKLRRRK